MSSRRSSGHDREKADLGRLRRFLSPPPDAGRDPQEFLFGRIAVRKGYLDPVRLDERLAEQRRTIERGRSLRIGQILLKHGDLTAAQILEILRAQERTLLTCPACRTLHALAPDAGAKSVRCPDCDGPLSEPADDAAILEALESSAGPVEGPTVGVRNRLGRYRLIRRIGSGGMAVVYEAEDLELKRRVAIKTLREDAVGLKMVQRLRREAEMAARLQHPDIITIHEVGSARPEGEEPVHYICMDLVEGRTLAEAVSSGDYSAREALAMIERVARAVHYAHGMGVIHRDLKQENILVTREGRPIVTDFGLALETGATTRLTRTGAILGTPIYMAPEQARGDTKEIDAQTDVYALGVNLYEIATGRAPFDANTAVELYRKISEEDPPDPRDLEEGLGPDIRSIILKAMAKEKARRYASAGDLADDLKRYLDGEPVDAVPPSFFYRLRRRLLRRKGAVVMAAAALMVLAGVLFLLVPSLQKKEAELKEKEEELEQIRARLLERLGDRAQIAFKSALRLRRSGDLAGMEELARDLEEAGREVLREAPDLAEPHYLLGRMRRMQMRFDEAGKLQEIALEKDPDHAGARYERGLHRVRKYEERIGALSLEWRRRQSEQSAGDPSRKIAEAPDRFELEEKDEAARNWRRGAEEDLERSDTSVAEALLAWLRGEPDAKDRFEAAAEETPEVEEIYEWLGRIARGEKDVREALRWYGEGLRRDKGYVPFLYGRAQANWEEAGRKNWTDEESDPCFRAAIADLEEVLRLDDDHVEAVYLLGLVRMSWGIALMQRGKDPESLFGRALEEFTRMIEIAPDDVRGWVNRAGVHLNLAMWEMNRGRLSTEHYGRAVDDLRQARAIDAKDKDAWYATGQVFTNWGNALMKRGGDPVVNYKAGNDCLETACKLDDSDADVWGARGAVHLNWGNHLSRTGGDPVTHYALSVRFYNKAVSLRPEDDYHLIERAWALVQWGTFVGRSSDPLKLFVEAIGNLNRAEKLNPTNFRIYLYRAGARLALARYQVHAAPEKAERELRAAIADFDRATGINSGSADGHGLRGAARGLLLTCLRDRNAGRDEIDDLAGRMEADFAKALQIDPWNARTWLNRGVNRFLLAKWGPARSDLEKAVELNRTMKSAEVEEMIRTCRERLADE